MSCRQLVSYSGSSSEGDDGDNDAATSEGADGGRRMTHSVMEGTHESGREDISPSLSPPPSKKPCLSVSPASVITASSLDEVGEVEKTQCLEERDTPPSLPLPDAILNMFSDQEEAGLGAESAKNHDGRVRSFAHVRGNWATHVYIPVSLPEEMKTCLTTFKNKIIKYFNRDHALQPLPLADAHISLSRTVPIQFHHIEPLADSLRSKVDAKSPFVVSLSTIAVYVNDDRTRSFIGLEVGTGHNEVDRLVRDVDRCFQQFRLSQYYKSPSFHMSVYWCLGDLLSQQLSHDDIIKLKLEWDNHLLESAVLHSSLVFNISEVRMKCGNKLFSFPLSNIQ